MNETHEKDYPIASHFNDHSWTCSCALAVSMGAVLRRQVLGGQLKNGADTAPKLVKKF
jgi:hypothetical protein